MNEGVTGHFCRSFWFSPAYAVCPLGHLRTLSTCAVGVPRSCVLCLYPAPTVRATGPCTPAPLSALHVHVPLPHCQGCRSMYPWLTVSATGPCTLASLSGLQVHVPLPHCQGCRSMYPCLTVRAAGPCTLASLSGLQVHVPLPHCQCYRSMYPCLTVRAAGPCTLASLSALHVHVVVNDSATAPLAPPAPSPLYAVVDVLHLPHPLLPAPVPRLPLLAVVGSDVSLVSGAASGDSDPRDHSEDEM